MLQKVFIKVGILIFALALVVGAMSFFSSNEFKKSVSDFFGVDIKAYVWCPEHTVDFEWIDPMVSAKWRAASVGDIQSRFCKVNLTPIHGIDLKKITFKPLLVAKSAEAKTALLEWSPESNLFQVQGLPFYSTSLSRELLDR